MERPLGHSSACSCCVIHTRAKHRCLHVRPHLMRPRALALAHSLTHSHSLIHTHIHSYPTHALQSPTQLTHPPCTLTHARSHALTHTLTRPLTHSLTRTHAHAQCFRHSLTRTPWRRLTRQRCQSIGPTPTPSSSHSVGPHSLQASSLSSSGSAEPVRPNQSLHSTAQHTQTHPLNRCTAQHTLSH
jgi:hypothetical protein